MGKTRQNSTGRSEVVIEDRTDADDIEILSEVRKEWVFETQSFEPGEPHARMDLSLGMTKNLGDYQFARMDLGVDIACKVEEVPEHYMRAKKWVGAQIKREVRRIDTSFVESGRLE